MEKAVMKIGFFGIFIGFVVGLGLAGVLTVKVEKASWNISNAASISAISKANNYYEGLDQTYDLGYKRCQDRAVNAVKELRRE